MADDKLADNEKLNSDESDESEDEDYVPSEHEVSEEDNSGDDEDFVANENEGQSASKSRKKKSKKPASTGNPRLGRGRGVSDEQSEQLRKDLEAEQVAAKEVKEKARTDALWASFLSDVGPKAKAPEKKVDVKEAVSRSPAVSKPKGTVKVTKVFDFAGETVRVDKEIAADTTESKATANGDPPSGSLGAQLGSSATKRPGGLGAVLGFISKKQKISTLDKSKLDWEKYKAEQGITTELKNHANSKGSYLERKEFLERADQRQFEQERDARLLSASKRKL
ncbi:Cfdp1 [Bugula neritina]|uniref:Craniofacial development protein 1 n=1 Tax=Bugula neritina TaxID=10212 RepID=A0A7J7IXW1_BUGNE|nr:Cfdp1 [Bugula neritina]